MAVNELTESEFPDFFAALWGRPPFTWQTELAKRVLNNTEAPWPQAINLPTGAGKTACLDIAVFALAAQAALVGRKEFIAAPRRIFLVVDRRIVVDEAYERARKMACKLEKASSGILKQVADNLRKIAGHSDNQGLPLEAHILRGGIYRSEAWGRNPLQPSIVTSTVDQIGSRLLFRAYGGSSSRVWPIYAGLAANDSLILLDEAHCARPFMQTLQAINKYRQWGHEPLQRPFSSVVMSATPPPDLTDIFEDTSAESRNSRHPLGRRQLACKLARLEKIKSSTVKKAPEKIAKAIVDHALELAKGKPKKAVVAFVNRVATARTARDFLLKSKEIDCELLTGRMRAIDKEIVQKRLEHLRSGTERVLRKSLIVVATQTLEVGADLDFDGLVTECASLDALRQRFGRLNRMGRDIDTKAVILYVDGGKNESDPVYGEALQKTWKWLEEQKDSSGEVDFGIAELQRRLPDGEELSKLNAPATDAAVMLPAHVDCLGQTAPIPKPSPDISLFLHGRREAARDVEVCWRADVNLNDGSEKEDSLESLQLCPPTSIETLAVPIRLFKHWLAGQDIPDTSADVEGASADSELPNPINERRWVLRWRGRETSLEHDMISRPEDIRPNDLLVIPFVFFGESCQLGDLTAQNGAELDQGDMAHLHSKAKAILRLHPEGIRAWPESLASIREDAEALLMDLQAKYDDDSEDVMEGLHRILKQLAAAGDNLEEQWRWLKKAASALDSEFPSARRLDRSGACHVCNSNLTVIGRKLIPEYTRDASIFSDEDDATSSGISHRNGSPVLLKKHLPGVERFARDHAEGCGLPNELVEAIACAGLLHDLGKADPRFQKMLHGGLPSSGEVLAKSSQYPKNRRQRNRIREESGYPGGARHELLSVRMAESAPELLPKDDELRELVLHLVASHHGYCRPFAPVVDDENHPKAEFQVVGHLAQWTGGPLGLERLDSGVSERYWRLTKRYGWWGLSWLEALLRLADWRRSEWEEQNNGDN